MKKLIKKLTYGLLCATTIGCMTSCNSNNNTSNVDKTITETKSNEDLIKEAVESYVNEHKDELKGEKGDKGETGEQGEKGETGKDGINGLDGKDGSDSTLPTITTKYYCGYANYMKYRKFNDKHETGIFYNQSMADCQDIYELETTNLLYLTAIRDSEDVFGHNDYIAYYVEGLDSNYEWTEVCYPNYNNDYSKQPDYVYDSATGEKYITGYTRCHNCGLESITDKLTNNKYINSFSYTVFAFSNTSNVNSLKLPNCYNNPTSHQHTIFLTKK